MLTAGQAAALWRSTHQQPKQHSGYYLLPQVGAWTSHIIEGILKKLAGLQKPMKYVCHVSLTQRAGAGLHAASCSRWNPKTDGEPGREGGSMTVSLCVHR